VGNTNRPSTGSARDPGPWALEFLRVGVGVVWGLNVLFIVAPANAYFTTFQSAASAYEPTSLGGPGLAQFFATYPTFFAWVIAGVTVYLAVAFLLGLTTRLACVIGAVFSIGFLVTQYTATFSVPGSNDVGAHPLYLLIYLVLFVGGAGLRFSLDRWVWRRGGRAVPRIYRWFGAPRDPDLPPPPAPNPGPGV
jgi:uncharacterized membrane protein YphA (DoxX/SURF4 family)